MTPLEHTRRLRLYASLAAIFSSLAFLAGTIFYNLTGSWATWAIMALLGMSAIYFGYAASKLEVLRTLGVSLQAYVAVKKRQKGKR